MRLYGGIDLGGAKIQALVADHAGAVVGEARRRTPQGGDPVSVLAVLAEALAAAADPAGVALSALEGVGVGAPGIVDDMAGTDARAGNLPGFEASFPLGPSLRAVIGAPVVLTNDARAAPLAEARLGAGRGARSLLAIFWGSGIGGGLVLDGRVWTGAGSAGEIGHTIVSLAGRRCQCGARGCVEALAGRVAMEARAREALAVGRPTRLFEIMEAHGSEQLVSPIWQEALEAGDELATEIVADALLALGAAIASAVNLIQVERIVVGGGLVSRLGPRALVTLRAELERSLFARDAMPLLRVAALGDHAGALGAALTAASAPAALAEEATG